MCLDCNGHGTGERHSERNGDSRSTAESDGTNWKRRSLLQATGVAAGTGVLLGSQSDRVSASHTECDSADRWVEAANHSARDHGIDWIVIHVTAGAYQGALNTLTSSDSGVSSHYLVKNYSWTDGPEPGHVDQLVHHDRAAWHARYIANHRSIGIEHEWFDDNGITDACYEASAELVRCIADMHDIPLEFYTSNTCIQNEPGGIIGHTHVPDGDCSSFHHGGRTCPYPDWDMDHFADLVRDGDGGGGGNGFEDGDTVETTVDLNGREGPGLHYDVVRTYPTGTTGEIMNGPETSDGYTWWGIHFPSYNEWVWCVEQYLTHA
ncbi:peptidoglycan recognition protein family protein [Natronobacterium texcoconense]|uniref:N-acetylmuramoyl-L-alanine amidase n=1 Tax=Natronobacterium texcoconense TaxID=1095778 RepID=A0A1H1GT75_NATTX|nr:peptidoglycan recognition family protein [Natronobacterium texcoconense]SDR16377.1 N-acetylmuramoyl-L-alanine amidase [Natronobacterium texcoconense]